MKRLFEFNVFDLMKDKGTETFLRKVKEENPDEYGHFVTIVGNKGLEVAKERYQDYDPNYWKEQAKKEKENKLINKRENKKEEIKRKGEEMLILLDSKIKMVNALLENTILNGFLKFINGDKNIKNFLDGYKAKKKYKNLFVSLLKKPIILKYRLYNDTIDTLSFEHSEYNFDYDERDSIKKIIEISQHFNFATNKLTYSIYFSMPDIGSNLSKQDNTKKRQYIGERNKLIYNLRKIGITKNEVIEQLEKLSNALSEELYDDWYKEWEFKNDTNKYNL
jgi:hypothetical protein